MYCIIFIIFMQVAGDFLSTVNNLIDVDNNELRSSNEQSGSVNR